MDYSKFLSKRVTGLKPSGIRRFFDVATTMPNCISLGVGEPNFVTPDFARESAIESIRRGETKYTSNSGLLVLREQITRYMQERFDLYYPPEDIIITVGASEGIDNAIRATVEPGDEVLIPEPCFVAYSPCVILAGGVPVGIPCVAENGFIVTKEILEQYITPKTKLLLLAFPTNPTGGIMTREQLEAIAPTIIKHDLLVLSDEIYAELTYNGIKHTSIANIENMKERTIVINGFSKFYAMTGWRIGFVCAPKEIIKQVLKIHQYAIMCAPTAGQYAALSCLEQGFKENFETVEMMKREYDKKRKFLYNSLISMGLDCFEPLGAFYMFPSVKSLGLDGETFALTLLKDKEVAVVPGEAFGECGRDFVRISYAYSMEKLEMALDRISAWIQARK